MIISAFVFCLHVHRLYDFFFVAWPVWNLDLDLDAIYGTGILIDFIYDTKTPRSDLNKYISSTISIIPHDRRRGT